VEGAWEVASAVIVADTLVLRVQEVVACQVINASEALAFGSR